MRTEKLFVTMSCAAVLGLFLASCAPAVSPPVPKPALAPAKEAEAPALAPRPAAPSSTPVPAAEQPRYGGILTAVATVDPPNLDVQRQVGVATFALAGPVYSGLLQYDPQDPDRLIGDLAVRWEMSPDARVYTFYLHKGIKSHDGKPFTSEDVRFSLKRIEEFAELAAYIPLMDKIETPDENTLKITLQRPMVGWAGLAGHGRIQMAPKHVIQEKGNLNWTVIGTGPFKFSDYAAGVQFNLTKNKDYFIPGRPYLDGLTFYVIRDAATQLAAFKTHRVKFIGSPTYGIMPSQAATMQSEMSGKVVIAPWPRYHFFCFVPNPDRKPWNDVRVRRAAFLAVDREAGVKVVADGFGDTGVTWVPPEWALPKEELMKMPGFRKPKDQDIAEAKRLMAEAGYPSGVKTTSMIRAAYKDYENIGLFMKDQLAKIGIDLELQVTDYTVFLRKRAERDLDSMPILADFGVSDPNITYRYVSWKYGKLSSMLDDAKMIELLDKQSTMLDKEGRKKIMYELQYRAAEVVPHIQIAWVHSYVGYWPEVRNYKAGYGLNNNLKMQDVWLAQ